MAEPLERFCRRIRKETSPRAYQSLVTTATEYEQLGLAVRLIQYLQFIRDQFRLICEYLEDDVLIELRGMTEERKRDDKFTSMYVDILTRMHPDPTLAMAAAATVYATTNGHMGDRLYQLEHPALHRKPLPQRIIDAPRGEFIDGPEALRRFNSLIKSEE